MSAGGYRDYWKVLGLERGADGDAVKKAFRKLARQHHPDVNPGDKAAEARFKEISEAYEVLSDPDKRRRYEQFGQYWNQAGVGSGGPGAGFDVDFGRYGNFDDFINDLLGRFGAGGTPGTPGGFPGGFGGGFGAPPPAANLDAEASIEISLGEAFRGCERTLQVNQERVQVRILASQTRQPATTQGQGESATEQRPARRPLPDHQSRQPPAVEARQRCAPR